MSANATEIYESVERALKLPAYLLERVQIHRDNANCPISCERIVESQTVVVLDGKPSQLVSLDGWAALRAKGTTLNPYTQLPMKHVRVALAWAGDSDHHTPKMPRLYLDLPALPADGDDKVVDLTDVV